MRVEISTVWVSRKGVETLEVSIDGVPLNDPWSYRASSPEGGFVFMIEEGSILTAYGYDAGDRYPAIVDGYWIMLPPLSVGLHTIQWSSSGQYQDGSDYSWGIIWHLNVAP